MFVRSKILRPPQPLPLGQPWSWFFNQGGILIKGSCDPSACSPAQVAQPHRAKETPLTESNGCGLRRERVGAFLLRCSRDASCALPTGAGLSAPDACGLSTGRALCLYAGHLRTIAVAEPVRVWVPLTGQSNKLNCPCCLGWFYWGFPLKPQF